MATTDKIDRKMKAKLENLLTQAEIQLTDLQKDQLIQLVQLLNKWNKASN